MTTRRPPRKLSDVLTPTLSSSPNDGELETEESSDDSNLPPFDLAAALQCVSSIPSPSPTVRTPRRGRPPGAGGRWPKKPPVVTETTYCFTLRGPNSLLKTDKTAQFTIGGVYELKCGVLTPGRTAYACRTLMTLFCDDPHIWSQIDKQMESGILLNGQTAPKHIMTMDRPSPRTHRNVKAGRNSLEFTWDASGTIFVYLRFLAALSDLCSDPCTLRLCIQSTFLDEPYDENTKTLMIETVGHPSLIDTSAGSTGSIDVHNDPIDRIIPEDPTRELLFEAQPTEIDDTDFVRNVINNVAKGMVGQDNSPMAMIERAIQDSLQKPEDNNGRFEVRVSAATLGEALGSFLNGSTPTGHTPPNSNTPRPRGRPRKFHYPEYCYSKTALQKQPPSNPSQWGGPAAEMMAIQEMQRKSANAEIPEKRIKMDILDEKPINMLSLMNGNGCLFDESDKIFDFLFISFSFLQMDDLDVIDVGGPEELMFSEEYMTGLNSQIAEVIGGGNKKKRRQRNERRDIKRERLYVEGFRYNFDRDSSCGQRAFWRCVKKGECLARVHTRVDTGEVIKSTGKHCHPPCYDHTKGEPNQKSSRCSTTSPSDRLDSLTEKSPSPFISSSDDVCSSSTMVAVKEEEEDDEDSINQYPHSVISALSHPLHSPSMDEQSTSDYPEDTEFIKIFALTKEVVNFVKTKMENDVPSSSCMEDLEPCQEVKLFLTNRRMGNYCGIFAKFTLSEMRALSSEDCRVICANDAEGLRLYHSLRQRQSASSSSKLRIFVAPKLDEEEEPCYELLNLIPPTVSELQNCLHSKGMMGPEVTKICVTGPNGINVQLSDEILETWEDNSVFQCYSSTNVLKMIPVNDSS